jgi:hypothetical protein
MKPIDFKQRNVTYAENQPEYIALPAHRDGGGVVTSCWKFSLRERIKILLGAKFYWQQLTYGQPLQPVKPNIGNNPLEATNETR